MPVNHSDDVDHIRIKLKSCDKERYLSVLFVGGAQTQSLWTLYAFNCELAKISHIVQEPMLGKMRLQWWYDVIANSKEKSRTALGHPIADQLSEMIALHDIDLTLFYKIIDARHKDFEGSFFETQQDFDDYHDAIWGNLYRIAYLIKNEEPASAGLGQGQEDDIFKTAGLITGMLKFLSLADDKALAEHQELLTQETSVENFIENTGSKNVGSDEGAIAAYKALQTKSIGQNLEILSDFLKQNPSFDARIFLSLVLAPHALHQWEQKKTCLSRLEPLNPLRQFYILWRASKKGLIRYLH